MHSSSNKKTKQTKKKYHFVLMGDKSVHKEARSASIWYILLVVFSLFGGIFIESYFLGSGDASVIISKIQDNSLLYRLGIGGFLAGQICQIFVMLALYKLFQSVDRDQTRAILVYVVVMVAMAFNLALFKLAPSILLSDAVFLQAFEPIQLQAVSMLFIELHSIGLLIVQVFWGLWLLPIGLLTIKSSFLPRILGIFLLVGCAGHIVSSLTPFLPESAVSIFTQIGTILSIGELPFFFWLIIFGTRNIINSNSYSHIA